MEGEGLASSLLSFGWHLSSSALHRYISSSSSSSPDGEHLRHIQAQLLDTDLKEIGAPCLPDSSTMLRKQRLPGCLVLQVASVRDISESSLKASARVSGHKQHGRLLRFCLTDGITTIKAIEYGPVPQLSLDIPPGTKVRMENCRVQSGIALLDSQSFHVLGGRVQALFEAWEMECKYSGLARSTLRVVQGEGASGPPPFKGLAISMSTKLRSSESCQPAEQMQDGSYSSSSSGASTSKNSIRSGYTAERPQNNMFEENTVKNVAKASLLTVRPRSEVYLPKTQASCEETRVCIEKELPKPTFPAPKDVSRDMPVTEDYGAVESRDITEMTTSGTAGSSSKIDKQTEIGVKNSAIEGRAEAISAAISLGLDVTPLQNRVAAQKLLEKHIGLSSKDIHYDGRRGHWKGENTARGGERGRGRGGRNKEKETFTLDEWESRKTMSNYSLDSRQQMESDAELAWKLQKQLNMQIDEVAAVKEMDEAEKIRMNMFNFGGNRSEQELVAGRVRGRGRGRGRRRGR